MIFYPSVSLRHFFYACFLVLVSACQNSVTPPPDKAQQQNQISATDAQQIDRLLTLIDQRLGLASQVAKSKWNSNSAIDDQKREAKILKQINVEANSMGIKNNECSFTLMRNFFQNQFDAGKIIQKNLWVNWRNTYPAGHQFKDAPNLTRDIRPALDKLTPELIIAFCNTQPILAHPGVRSYLTLQANSVIRNDANGSARHQALKGLQEK